MNRLLIAVAISFTLAVAAFGQEPATNAVSPVQKVNAGQMIWNGVTSGASNWDATVCGVYAERGGDFGVRGAIVYKANDYVLVGPQIMYFRNAVTIGSVNATFQLPIQPIAGVDWLTVTPIADVGSGYDTKSGTAVGIAEAGGAITIGSTKTGRFAWGILGTIGKITSIDGEVVTGGLFGQVNFGPGK